MEIRIFSQGTAFAKEWGHRDKWNPDGSTRKKVEKQWSRLLGTEAPQVVA